MLVLEPHKLSAVTLTTALFVLAALAFTLTTISFVPEPDVISQPEGKVHE